MNLLNTQILTLHFTRRNEMFVKRIKCRCECVQEWIKRCTRMNVFLFLTFDIPYFRF